MDFFQAQDSARKKSGRLVFLYIAAVIGIIATIYFLFVFGMYNLASSNTSPGESPPEFSGMWWQPDLFFGTAVITIGIIGLGSLFKTMSLRAGGGVVARSVGGQLVPPNTSDPQRRRLVNIVEEMSIAAGIRMPEVYVLPEAGINAFAAGYSPDDAAVAVTQGALDTLSRDELQGVVAHEFSHILNGDMRLNIRLIGLLFGILLLTIIGRIIVRAGFSSSSGRSSKNAGGAIAIALLGLAVIIIGYVGVFFGRLIQAAVSRQREFLADASAVQFTRNPDGIAGALKKIGRSAASSRIANVHATETSHMFFASALRSSFSGLFATHPPLVRRIKAIDPSFDGNFNAPAKPTAPPQPAQRQSAPPARPAFPGASRAIPPPLPATAFLAAVSTAAAPDSQLAAGILAAIPQPLADDARDPERARAILLALLYSTDNAAAAAKQDAAIARTLTTTERMVLIEAVRQIAAMPSWARLPLGDIALASIRHIPAPQIGTLLAAIDAFIDADDEVSLYEHALRQVIHRNLRPPGRPGHLIHSTSALSAEIGLLLSAIARAGSSAPGHVQAAFDAGAAAIGGDKSALVLSPPDALKPDALIKALARLDHGAPAVKQAVLTALVRAASADGQIAPAEQDMWRAVAAALNCPAPVLLAQ